MLSGTWIFYIFFFLLFFVLGFYTYYLFKYPKPPDKSYLQGEYPEELILKLGGKLHHPQQRLQHFFNFSPAKGQNTIRIGAFGDSFTYGYEVDEENSYPHQLQELFDRNYPNHSIEVLNFGTSGSGFQEQFILWERYAKIYKLDYILFGPLSFDSKRDTTFSWPYSVEHPRWWYPKARFILDKNNKLRLIHIKGKTLKEKYKNYYRLIPSWTALRYDRRPFQILELLFPVLRYKIKNPFYYTRLSYNEEALQINKKLLEKIKKRYHKKILFFTEAEDIFHNYQSVAKLYNLNFFSYNQRNSLTVDYNIPQKKVFLKTNSFYTTYEHESALGNELVAQIYFNGLMGNSKFSLNVIRCRLKTGNEVSIPSFSNQNLWDMDSIEYIQVFRENTLISDLRHNSVDHYWRDGTYHNHKIQGTKSFIGFYNPTHFLSSPYIPLLIPLKEGMKLYMKLQDQSRIELGQIKSLDSHNKFFDFYSNITMISFQDFSNTHWRIHFSLKELKEKYDFQSQPKELFIMNHKLGDLIPEKIGKLNNLKFIPSGGYNKSFLFMGPSHRVREEDFPHEFSLYIRYKTLDNRIFKSFIPYWTCRKEKQPIHLSLPNFLGLTK